MRYDEQAGKWTLQRGFDELLARPHIGLVPVNTMRSIRRAIVSILIFTACLAAESWKFGPIPPAAAELISGLPGGFQSVEEIRQNYLAAALPIHEGANTILVKGRGGSPVCGAQNCPAYILEKAGPHYRLLLNPRSVQQVQVLNSVTDGYHDIQTTMHGSATSYALFIYRYDGMEYKRTDCFSKEYRMRGSGTDAVPAYDKKPTITRTCGK